MSDMKRLKAAWMVLRGEWTASPPPAQVNFYLNHELTTAATSSNPTVFSWWTETR